MVTTTWTQTAGMTSETGTDNVEDYAEQAEASKDAAAASETAAASSATASASSASGSSTSAAEALASKNAAAVSETNAASSAATAATQASNSSTSATASETSRVASVAAQAAAETAETAAETAQTAAEAAEAGVAADAATATAQAAIATTQATNSGTSATASEASRVAAVAAQAAAETAETNAETAETNAETAEANAAASASTATTKASEAVTSALNASTSASTATTKASEASASASSASASEASASSSATSATNSASTATTKASEASTSASNAAASEAAAETAETNAETAETNAETAQVAAEAAETSASGFSTSASTSAATATTQAGIATTKAGEAAASATASASSATASEAAKDAALSALDNFQDQYLGDFASDPTTDNDGDPLQAGMLYFNTTDDVMKVYTGSAWVAAYASLSGALLTTNNLSDLNNAATARTNLGLGTAATTASTDYATAAQGALADSAVQPSDSPTFGSVTVTGTVDGRDVAADGTKLDGIEAGATADQTAAQILTAVKTVDGSGSGLDADLLDGNHASAFYLATNPNGYTNNTGTIVEDGTNFGGTYPVYFRIGANSAYSHANITFNGSTNTLNTVNIAPSGTVDGRDVASDGSKLDGIESGATADQTASQILTAIKTVDGSGSGLDADLWDGQQFSSYLNQSVTTTANVTHNQVTGTAWVYSPGYLQAPNAYIDNAIYHSGDTDTYLQFDAANSFRIVTGNGQRVKVNSTGVQLGDSGNGYFQPVSGDYGSIQIDGGGHNGWEGYSIGGRVVLMHDNSSTFGIYNDVNNEWMVQCLLNGAVNLYHNGASKLDTLSNGVSINGNLYTDGSNAEDYDALSGTSPTCNVDNAGAFSLTMSGDTTFTFSGADSGWSMGFILQLTGNGSTVTWPSSVDWAGGAAPDAPASGASNLYVFWTRDGGSNWHGVLSSAAYA